MEQARQKGYISGLQNGQAEGHEIARTALSPVLDSFSGAYDHVATLIPGMADIMGAQVIELTCALVERILGKAITLTQQERETLHASIVQKILPCYRLNIHIHPEDLNAIKELSRAVNRNCPEGCEVVSIKSDPDQTRGRLSLETAEDALADAVKELADLLPGFIPDRPDPSPGKSA